MAITLAQAAVRGRNTGSGTSIAVTLGVPVTSGNLVICPVVVGSAPNVASPISSVVDDKGNAYTVLPITLFATESVYLAIAYFVNATNAPQTITATFDQSRTFLEILGHEFTGFASSNLVIDGNSSNTQVALGTGTDNITSGNLTTTANGNLVFGVTIPNAGAGNTAGTGYTGAFSPVAGIVLTEFTTQTSAGVVAATFNNTSSADDYVTAAISFKIASGVPANCANQLLLIGVGCSTAAKLLEENQVISRRDFWPFSLFTGFGGSLDR